MIKYVGKTDVRKVVAHIDKTLDMIPSLWKKNGMSKDEVAFWSDVDHKISDMRLKIRRAYKV